MTLRTGLAMILVAALGACSTMTIDTNYDPDASFAGLESYAWLPRPEQATGDPQIDNNPLLDTRIRAAVNQTLVSKGFRQSSSGAPDFFVGYHVTLDQKTSITLVNNYYRYNPGWGYSNSAPYRPYTAYRPTVKARPGGPAQTYVYEFAEGTLIMDVVQPDGRTLIWRGIASDKVNFSAKPETKEKKINEAVERMFANFPPP